MTFSRVYKFKIFVPEKSGWLKYSQSLAEQDTWICNFEHQDGSLLGKTALLTHQQASKIWDRFCAKDTCETTLYS